MLLLPNHCCDCASIAVLNYAHFDGSKYLLANIMSPKL